MLRHLRALPTLAVGGLVMLQLLGGAVNPVAGQAEAAPERPWFVSRFTGEWRAWLPEADFPPETQETPHMLIYEVTQDPYGKPTAEQTAAAETLVAQVRQAVERNGWNRFEQAIEDGYELMVDDHTHYVRRDFITDGRVLDPDRPEFLMYSETPSGMQLVGTMFLMSELGVHGPQIGGPSTVWHYHVWAKPRCLWPGTLAEGLADDRGECVEGTPSHRSAEMIHVWLVDNPDGPFATNMVLAEGARHGDMHH